MDIIKRYRLPSFTIIAREPIDDERRMSGEHGKRDVITVEIRRKGENRPLVVPVGSPIIKTAGSTWDEDSATRSAVAFASEPSAWDGGTTEWYWSRENGETLSNEVFCHRVLGKEMRRGF